MDIKVFNSVPQKNERLVIGTHNGIFHSDEIVAIALMCLNHKGEVCIVRSRNLEELKKCDLLVDIGGGDYDHHQPGGNGVRPNGIPYASAGLVWDDLGCSIIHSLLGEKSIFEEYNEVCDSIDNDIISKVDSEDNGIPTTPHLFSFVKNFLPDWTAAVNPDYDAAFYEALSVVIKILRQEIMARISTILAGIKITSLIESSDDNHLSILRIPRQTFPWKEAVIQHNAQAKSDDDIINFVVFPYPDGGWAAQCVPPSIEREFEQRIPFPKEWAGQTDKLYDLTGLLGATFCHNGRFFARAESYQVIKKMCIIAIEENE